MTELTEIRMLPVGRIYPHPKNPRRDLGDLTELADSIKSRGVLQNLTVITPGVSYITGAPTPFEDENTYTVIIGHRRLAAAKKAGLTEVPCVVARMDEAEQLATMLSENVQRADLTVLEEAACFWQLRFDMGVPVDKLAQKTGYSASKVRQRLKIAELPADAARRAAENNATLADFAAVAELTDGAHREEALKAAGSAKFAWKVDMLKSREAAQKQMPAVLAKLREAAEEIVFEEGVTSAYSSPTWRHLRYQEQIRLPVDEERLREDGKIFAQRNGYTGKYFFAADGAGFTVYFDPAQEEKTPDAPGAVALEEEKRREARKKLDELEEKFAEKRLSFLRAVTLRKDREDWAHGLLHQEIQKKDEVILYDGLLKKFVDGETLNLANPAKTSLILWYCALGGDAYACWDGMYAGSEELDAVYTVLAGLGYEEDAEEARWRDGSHADYLTKEETP